MKGQKDIAWRVVFPITSAEIFKHLMGAQMRDPAYKQDKQKEHVIHATI